MKLYWTYEKLQEEANKYKTREEFSKNSSSAYIISRRRKLLNKLFENHENNGYNENRKVDGYWSTEKLQEEANKYKTRSEFYRESNSAYHIACSKNLINVLFKNHFNKGYDNNRVHRGYWTIEKLQKESNKYKTRSEFRKNDFAAYSAAKEKKSLDLLFINHPNEGYIDKKEWKENKYVIYVYELPEYNKAYVGLTNNINRRDMEHLFDDNELLSLFCKNHNIKLPNYKILEENLKSTDAQKKEIYWINYYKNNNYEMFNINKGGSLGSVAIKWTKNKLQKEANKYKTRGEFREKNNPAYVIARSKNLLNDIFKNHIYEEKYYLIKYWTLDTLQKEANKYTTRWEFRKHNKKAYSAAIKRKMINEIFKNHSNQGYTRIPKYKKHFL